VIDFMIGLGKLKLCTKFEVAALATTEVSKGSPKFRGDSVAQGHTLAASIMEI